MRILQLLSTAAAMVLAALRMASAGSINLAFVTTCPPGGPPGALPDFNVSLGNPTLWLSPTDQASLFPGSGYDQGTLFVMMDVGCRADGLGNEIVSTFGLNARKGAVMGPDTTALAATAFTIFTANTGAGAQPWSPPSPNMPTLNAAGGLVVQNSRAVAIPGSTADPLWGGFAPNFTGTGTPPACGAGTHFLVGGNGVRGHYRVARLDLVAATIGNTAGHVPTSFNMFMQVGNVKITRTYDPTATIGGAPENVSLGVTAGEGTVSGNSPGAESTSSDAAVIIRRKGDFGSIDANGDPVPIPDGHVTPDDIDFFFTACGSSAPESVFLGDFGSMSGGCISLTRDCRVDVADLAMFLHALFDTGGSPSACTGGPVGACCVGVSTQLRACLTLTASSCAYIGGTYAGDGTVCTADRCAVSTCSRWVGTAGMWSNRFNWDPPAPPDNSGCKQYCVTIPSPGSVVTLDGNRKIDSLFVNGFTVNITGGDLSIATPAGILNQGNIMVGLNRAIRAAPGVSFTISGGPNPLRLSSGSIISGLGERITNAAGHTIAGGSSISSDMINNGTISADMPLTTMTISGPPIVNNGTMQATNGGRMLIQTSISGGGFMRAMGSTIRVIGPGVVSGCVEVLPGSPGLFELDNSTAGTGLLLVTGGTAALTNGAQMTISGSTTISPAMNSCAILSLDATSRVVSQGSFTQAATGETDIQLGSGQSNWLMVSGTATLNGTLRISLATGFTPTPSSSFTLLTAGTRSGQFARLAIANFPAGLCAHVTYTPTTCVLTVDGIGSRCDMNCDVSRDGTDIQPFVNRLIGQAPAVSGCPVCTGDMNGDGLIDALDVAGFVNCVLP